MRLVKSLKNIGNPRILWYNNTSMRGIEIGGVGEGENGNTYVERTVDSLSTGC